MVIIKKKTSEGKAGISVACPFLTAHIFIQKENK
jgi:hypothetical protein